MAKLTRDLDFPVWKDFVFWLGVIFVLGKQPSWIAGVVMMIISLDRCARRRSRAERELRMLLEPAAAGWA